jgi:hypothetical protein
MRQSTRKLWGTVGFIVLIVTYPLAVAVLLGGWLASLPWWGAIAAVILAAAIWLYPAMGIIRWMSRPD